MKTHHWYFLVPGVLVAWLAVGGVVGVLIGQFCRVGRGEGGGR